MIIDVSNENMNELLENSVFIVELTLNDQAVIDIVGDKKIKVTLELVGGSSDNLKDFPIVDEFDIKLAKKFLEEMYPKPSIEFNDYKEKGLFLSKIPYSAFVGLTGDDLFDSKTAYLNDPGFFGKLNEWLMDGNLPNTKSEMDNKVLGEAKTQTMSSNGFSRDIELKTNEDYVDFSSFDTSKVYKKIKKGINLFGMKHFKGSKTVANLYRMDFDIGSTLYNESKSDFEVGKLNPYNRYLKFGTKNSGTTRTINIPKETVNTHAQLLYQF